MNHPKKSLKRTILCTNLLLASFVCHLSASAGVAGHGVDPSVLEANAAGPNAYTDGASVSISGALNGAPTGVPETEPVQELLPPTEEEIANYYQGAYVTGDSVA